MLEEYIKLLESFKEHQISKLIESINAKILAALNSPKFNREIATYLKKRNKEGVPFTDFATDPDSVSQIKKLINALYYARLTFIDLENIDVREWKRSVFDLKLLYSDTISKAYQASFLLTHLDVNLREIFHDELSLLVPAFSKFQTLTNQLTEQTNKLGDTLKKYPISYTSGFVSGTAIQQIRPQTGDIDFNFITNFSAVLPAYIDQFTQYLSQYSSQLIENESTLNKAKLLELQNAAYRLLRKIDDLRSRSIFAPLKILNYVAIIRHVITLSMSSLEQIGHLSDSSQDIIRGYLTELKYNLLPTLFGLVDKIEDNAMLKQGTLSTPLMQSMNNLYNEWLIFYTSKFVNFAAKGEELLSIEDSRFLALRLERTYKRIDDANKKLIKIQKAQLAFNTFFEILENELYNNYTVAQLPNDVKKVLLLQYKIIRPYMDKIDVELSNTIINGLNSDESWTAFASTYLFKPARWVIGKQAGHLDYLKAQKNTLQELISKDRASQQFHIKLNEDLIESVQKQTDLVLFPYNGENPFITDESAAISPEHGDLNELKFVVDDEGSQLLAKDEVTKLNSEQALDLYQMYRNKHNKFIKARDAYNQFVELLKPLSTDGTKTILKFNQLDKDVLVECRNLYNIFQPYFTCGVSPEQKKNATEIDTYLAHLFSGKETKTPDLPITIFHQFDEHFQVLFTKIDLSWNKKSKGYLREANTKYDAEIEAAPINVDSTTAQRAHYVIQNTNYSEFVKLFRANLYPWISILNESMRKQLVAQTSGIPFPELEDPNSVLNQPRQVIAFKRIFNSLYHVEGIVLALEKLNNNHSQSRYVYHLLEGYSHINEIMKLTKEIAADPHFTLIAHQLLDKAQTVFAAIQEHSDGYKESHETVMETQEVTNNSLWYVLNAFYISPNHIRAIRNDSYITARQQEELHKNAKRATLQIEGIIKSSSSYFKLFLQTPTMFELYDNLVNKLTEFTSTSHDSVISNLDQIKVKVFTPILIQADHWEDKLGLQPGLLSGPLKQITDEYLKGFLTPLDLKSKRHIELFCDNRILTARQEFAQKRIDKAKKQIKKVDKHYRSVELLYRELQNYFHLTDENYPGTEASIEKSTESLIQLYKKALPVLVQLKKLVNTEPSSTDTDNDLDEMLNNTTNNFDHKFNNIRAVVEGCYYYYLGTRKTFEMKGSTLEEKIKYLNDLGAQQRQADLDFVNQYVEASFNRQMDDYCNRHLGLQFVHKEYRTNLREYLLSQKKIITAQSKLSDDIDLSISNLLEEHIRLFENTHFTSYYQLDTIRVALAQFTLYFSSANTAIANGTSVFESKKTLAQKTQLINNLEDIAATGQLSIDEFIYKYKTDINSITHEISLIEAVQLETKKKKITLIDYIAIKNPGPDDGKLIEHIKQLIETSELTIDELVARLPEMKDRLIQKSKILRDLKNYAQKGHLTIEELITDATVNIGNPLEKQEAIKNLRELKEKVRLSVKERIDIIKTKVEPAQFKGILFASTNHDLFSVAYLKHCFYSLLEALHLYIPTRKRLYNKINAAVNTSHQISDLTNRFGLFSTTSNKSVDEFDSIEPYKTITA